jgi:alpha-beta hydrolase superfamily lysophospholipase
MFLQLFDTYSWSFNLIRLISQAHFGGAQFSEVYETAARIREGDRDSWYEAWSGTAERVEKLAEEAEAAGRPVSARALYQRATQYWRMADFFLLPDDSRRIPAYERSVACFAAAGRYFEPALERVEIPYEGTSLPGYFFPGAGRAAGERRPTVVFFGGGDSTAEELYFTAPGILERGLACLIVDGPGQGAALRLRGIPTRFDYEVPVSAAVDYALARPEVDPERLALCSMSLGGYYAPRAAAFEPRFKALVIWGACYDYHEIWRGRPDDHPLAAHMAYAFGVPDIQAAREAMKEFTLEGVLGRIHCSTLVVHGEDDANIPVEHAYRTYDELECPKDLMIFRSGESGSAHCQQDNLSRANEVIFDWLADAIADTNAGAEAVTGADR